MPRDKHCRDAFLQVPACPPKDVGDHDVGILKPADKVSSNHETPNQKSFFEALSSTAPLLRYLHGVR